MSTRLADNTYGRAQLPGISQEFDFCDAEDITSFTTTALASGSIGAASGINGVVRFTGAATTNNSGAQIQQETAEIDIEAGGVYSTEARIRLNDTAERLVFGFIEVNANLLGSIANGVHLVKAAGASGAWSLVIVRASGGTTTIALPQLAADTSWHVYYLRLEASRSNANDGTLTLSKDGLVVYQGPVSSNAPGDVAVTPSVCIASGSASGTQTGDLDYLRWKGTRSPN